MQGKISRAGAPAWTRFREKLAALEALGPDNPFVRQCSLSLQATTGGDENGPYSPDRRLSMLLATRELRRLQLLKDEVMELLGIELED